MSRGKILVVDDEIDVIRAVSLRLRANGYDVVAATDGVDAIHMALAARPDLVILDIGLPRGDGFTVAQNLLQTSETRWTPIIFLTARTSEEDRIRAFKAGTARYLTKPWNAQDLLDSVDRAMSCVRPWRATTQPQLYCAT